MTKFKENETVDEFIDRSIDEICKSANVSPGQTLRRYMENIIYDIVAGYLRATGYDGEMESLNSFFKCEDFIDLTWGEIYKGIFYSNLVEDYNNGSDEMVDEFQPDCNPEPKKVIHFANEMN